jgi:hypothetical protein
MQRLAYQFGVADDYVNAISTIPDGSGCPGGLSYHGGFNGCGCHMAVSFGTNSSVTFATIDHEDWAGIQQVNINSSSASYWYYTGVCNYNPTTYPWSGGM